MKLYTFLDTDENIIEQVRAETHTGAVARSTSGKVHYFTDFYSETPLEEGVIN